MEKPIGIEALNTYSVNIASAVEEITWSFYDTQTYVAAGQTQLNFFQQPVGAGGTTYEQTNMDSAGQIPKGQRFLTEYIALEFFPGIDPLEGAALTAYADDYLKFISNGWLEFKIGSKLYVQHGNLGLYTPSFGLSGFAATGAADAVEYATNRGKLYSILPVQLTSNQNFSVSLKWGTGVAISADAIVKARLCGRLFRNAQ